MQAVTERDFNALAQKDAWCASVYMPLEGNGQDRLAWQVMLSHAKSWIEQDLAAVACPPVNAEKILASLDQLRGSLPIKSPSVAVLLSEDFEWLEPLPMRVDFVAYGNRRFYLRPLIPLIVESDCFYVLLLTENVARLYSADSVAMREIDVADLPSSKEEAIQDDQVERSHCVTSGGTGFGRNQSRFHGQGGKADTAKPEMLEYITRVAHCVDAYLQSATSPLVVASSDWTYSVWRDASHYAYALDTSLGCSLEHVSDAQIHEAAWAKVFQTLQTKQVERFEHWQRQSSLYTESLTEIVPAAVQGRVRCLLVDGSKPIYGIFDEEQGKAEFYADSTLAGDDLLDLAAVQTARHGGMVLPMFTTDTASPHRASAMRALLRF